MEILVYIVCFLMVFSKFLDCYTTSSKITTITQEKNPLARKLMTLFGVHTTIWGIFGLTILIVVLSVWLLKTFCNTTIYKVVFIHLGILVSVTQFAVAHTNWSKRPNFLTKFLLKLRF